MCDLDRGVEGNHRAVTAKEAVKGDAAFVADSLRRIAMVNARAPNSYWLYRFGLKLARLANSR
jgi:hypothetical protein